MIQKKKKCTYCMFKSYGSFSFPWRHDGYINNVVNRLCVFLLFFEDIIRFFVVPIRYILCFFATSCS